jgi:ABC-type transport system substrate-binding protein
VNYAIDRPALAQHAGQGFAGKPTDQYIPPGIPGFEDAAVYPLGGPDLAEARRLAGDERQHVVLYTCNQQPGCTQNAQILRSNLDAIGIDLEVRQFPEDAFFNALAAPDRPWDLARYGWAVDYADPFNFINTLYGPGAAPSDFRDPGMWRRMAAASRLSGEKRLRAYAGLDRDLAERAAPAAAFSSGIESHFLSARMGCQVLHPIYGLDLAALCVRDDVEDE